MIKKLLLSTSFLTIVFLGIGHSTASADINCGVLTGDQHSYAGLIIGYKAYDSTYDPRNPEKSLRNPKTGGEVTKVDSIWPNLSAGNLIHYTNESDRRDSINFTPDTISIGDVDRCAIGTGYYGLTVLGETRNNQDGWQLDCDVSLGAQYQTFKVEILKGQYPRGLEPGGYWRYDAGEGSLNNRKFALDPNESRTVTSNGARKTFKGGPQGGLDNPFPYTYIMPANGYAARLTFAYHEPYHWRVNGSVNANATTGAPGSEIIFNHKLTNTGPNTMHSKFTIKQVWNKKVGADVTKTIASNTPKTLSPGDSYTVSSNYVSGVRTSIPSDAKDGDKICQILEYVRYHSENNKYAGNTIDIKETRQDCVIVKSNPTPSPVFKPYFQVEKGSIMAGCEQGVLAGFFNNNNANPLLNNGSGVEFGALSNNPIIGFASGINNPDPLVRSKQAYFSFADSPFSTDGSNPKVGGSFGLSNCSRNSPLALTNSGSGPTNIDSKTVTGLEKAVYKGDVFITGDIKYSNPNTWTKDNMPSYLIKARNIYISAGVTQLDGTYIAEAQNGVGGAIYTCAFGAAPPDRTRLFGECNKPLTVYGAFLANKVNLLRTYGDINDKTKGPAERFIFSPEILINGTDTGTSGGSGSTTPYDRIYNLPPIL